MPAGAAAAAAFPDLLLLCGFLIPFESYATSFLAAGGAVDAAFLLPPFGVSLCFFVSSTFFLAVYAVFFCGYVFAISCVV